MMSKSKLKVKLHHGLERANAVPIAISMMFKNECFRTLREYYQIFSTEKEFFAEMMEDYLLKQVVKLDSGRVVNLSYALGSM